MKKLLLWVIVFFVSLIGIFLWGSQTDTVSQSNSRFWDVPNDCKGMRISGILEPGHSYGNHVSSRSFFIRDNDTQRSRWITLMGRLYQPTQVFNSSTANLNNLDPRCFHIRHILTQDTTHKDGQIVSPYWLVEIRYTQFPFPKRLADAPQIKTIENAKPNMTFVLEHRKTFGPGWTTQEQRFPITVACQSTFSTIARWETFTNEDLNALDRDRSFCRPHKKNNKGGSKDYDCLIYYPGFTANNCVFRTTTIDVASYDGSTNVRARFSGFLRRQQKTLEGSTTVYELSIQHINFGK